MIRFIEELSLNALPSQQTVYYDGWIVRFANGYTRRANSVNPLYPSTIPLEEKIEYCEALYGSKGQSTIFKLTSAVQPESLPEFLSRRGYIQDALTSVQTASLDDLPMPDITTVTISSGLTERWLDDHFRLNQVDPRHRPAMTHVLTALIPRACYITLQYEGETAAVGVGILERGYVGLYDIVTAAPFRNRGVGRQLLLNILQWAKTNGAYSAYLQVMLNNAPALHLYGKLGFREVYQYWYCVRTLTT